MRIGSLEKRRCGWRIVAIGGIVFASLCSPAVLGWESAAGPPQPHVDAGVPYADESEDEAETVSLSSAHDLLMGGSYEDALDAYEKLAQNEQDRVDAQIGIARSRMRLGRYDEAISGLQVSPATDSADLHYVLAELLSLTGEYAQALEHAKRATELKKGYARARLLRANILELLGEADEALDAFRWFETQVRERAELPRDAEWITATALGFLRYSTLTQTNVATRTQHVLHEMLQMAYERVDRTYWPARIAAADLLRERFNNDKEDGSVADYNAALRINDKLCEAHVGLGEVALENWNFEEAERKAERALKVNPNHAPALHLRAKSLLRERRYKQAADLCERALQINPHDIIALSLSAAAAACQYDSDHVALMRARVKAINPANATIHRILGDALSGIRQYEAAEIELFDAIKLAPVDANPRTELGMMYMQWGLEDKARDTLVAAWDLDPFNQRTKFTLELLESLQKFARIETEHFIVKYDASSDPTLGGQMAEYLEGIYPSVVGDFAAPLEEKTIIEVFPTQRAFAVRITGSPWIHTIGACTGRLIAMASPRRATELTGTFNFARVLTHEFTHVVTLAATKNRIPHWFTEGLAVAQEDSPRDYRWWQLLVEQVRRDELFTLESIDWAFIRPKRATDRSAAYAQSEWMCEYIVQRFGYDTLNAMMKRFRDGETQAEVLKNQLELEPETFDNDFREWAKTDLARWGFDLTPPEDVIAVRKLAKAQPESAALLGRLARAEFDAGEYQRALGAANHAIELDENQPAALKILAEIFGMNIRGAKSDVNRRQYEAEAIPTLEKLLGIDLDGWLAPKLLGEIALRRKDWERAKTMFTRLQRLCPFDMSSWRGLAGVYLARGDHDLALPQLLELARFEADDAEVAKQIARIYAAQNRIHDARYWYRQAIFADPLNADIHKSFGDAVMRAGQTEAALREYLLLTELEPGNAKHFEIAAIVAHKLGKKGQASVLARRALELDPESSARSLLP